MKYLRNNKTDVRLWPKKTLVAAVLFGLAATVSQTANSADRKPIGDLEIYKSAEPGTATIFMMLDVSGSMGRGSIGNDYGRNCSGRSYGGVTSEEITVTVLNDDDSIREAISFTPKGCTIYGAKRFDRLSRLQKALIELLADEVYEGNRVNPNRRVDDKGSIGDDYEIGLGIYSYRGRGREGVVLVPTAALTADQRIELINEIRNLNATGNTPTAQALAEAGAYMMGTTTKTDTSVVGQRSVFNNRYIYRQCDSNATGLSYDSTVDGTVYDCTSWGGWSYGYVIPSFDFYSNGTYYRGNALYSGFDRSVSESKKDSQQSYDSPLNFKECSGNGIYLLTDGQPNGSSDEVAKSVMNTSLEGSPLTVDSCNALSGSSNQAWGCMAEYTELLRNPANPGKLPIKTATVGFGKSFAGLSGTRTIIADGKTLEVTDCDSGDVGRDARNLCKLGERRGDNENKTFGDGGFYYTEGIY